MILKSIGVIGTGLNQWCSSSGQALRFSISKCPSEAVEFRAEALWATPGPIRPLVILTSYCMASLDRVSRPGALRKSAVGTTLASSSQTALATSYRHITRPSASPTGPMTRNTWPQLTSSASSTLGLRAETQTPWPTPAPSLPRFSPRWTCLPAPGRGRPVPWV